MHKRTSQRHQQLREGGFFEKTKKKRQRWSPEQPSYEDIRDSLRELCAGANTARVAKTVVKLMQRGITHPRAIAQILNRQGTVGLDAGGKWDAKLIGRLFVEARRRRSRRKNQARKPQKKGQPHTGPEKLVREAHRRLRSLERRSFDVVTVKRRSEPSD